MKIHSMRFLHMINLLLLFFYLVEAQDLPSYESIELNTTLWTEVHNKVRSYERAANMQEMHWDDNLASLAAQAATTCKFQQRPLEELRSAAGYDQVGENVFAALGFLNLNPELVIEQNWYTSERLYFIPSHRKCAPQKVCRHYVQLMWAEACAVGCAAVRCKQLELGNGVTWKGAYYVVCHYGPSDGLGDRLPYVEGPRCSECSSRCNRGLCTGGCASSAAPPQIRPQVDPMRNYNPPQRVQLATDCVKEDFCVAVGSPECRSELAYLGTKSTTRTGKRCQKWSEKVPHYHQYYWVGSHNKCRNPAKADGGPWCFTTDLKTRWEYCFYDCNNIPEETTTSVGSTTKTPEEDVVNIIEEIKQPEQVVKVPVQTLMALCVYDNKCYVAGTRWCQSETGYDGDFSTTINGRICQKWTSQTPHSHFYEKVGDHNKCRIVGGAEAPWCYTTDPDQPWEYCFPTCEEFEKNLRPELVSTSQSTTLVSSSLTSEAPQSSSSTPETPQFSVTEQTNGTTGKMEEMVQSSSATEEPSTTTEKPEELFTAPILHPTSPEYALFYCDEYDPNIQYQCKVVAADKWCELKGFKRAKDWEKERGQLKTMTLTTGYVCDPKLSELGGCWQFSMIICI